MARLWHLQGSPLLIILLLSMPFIVLLLFGGLNITLNSIPLSTQVLNSYQFDSGSQTQQFSGFSCSGSNSVGAPSVPSWCPGTGSFSQFSSNWPGGSAPTVNLGQAGGYYFNPATASPACAGNIFSFTCGEAQALLGGAPGMNSYYQLQGGLCACNWQLLGSTANAAWQSQFQETIPTTSTGQCPFTLLSGTGCNPFTVVLKNGAGNSSIAYNIYRFTFLITLQTKSDTLTVSTVCTSGGILPPTGSCYQNEVNALNQVFAFVDSGDSIAGQFKVDISIPDPFTYSSFGTSATDQYGIIGAWIAGQNGCSLSAVTFGGTIQVSPCLSHTVIPDLSIPYTPSSTEPQLSSYTNPVTSNLNPNAVLQFTVNKIQTYYKASLCNSGSGSNCPGSGQNDCTANGGCVIQADYGMLLQIPLVVDVIGSGPNLQQQAANIGLITSTTTPPYNPLTGNIKVHTQDSVLGFPLTGVPVNYGAGNTCSTSNAYGTTDKGGNIIIVGLPAGQYTVCSTGQSGGVNLLIITLQLQYSLASAPVNVNNGSVTNVQLSLQPTLASSFTIVGLLLAVLAVIIFIVGILFKLRIPNIGGNKSTVIYRRETVPPPKRKQAKRQKNFSSTEP